MKIFISVKIVCLAFSLSFCSPAIQQLRSEKTITEKEVQNSGEKNIAVKYFTVSINTNDSIRFKQDGKVNVSLAKDNEVFDITQLHQQHRLNGLKNLLMSAR